MAHARAPATSADQGYIIKSALAEAFVHGTVRPWRQIPTELGFFRVVGVVDDPKAVKPNPSSRRLGVIVEVMDHAIEQGQAITLDIMSTAVKRIPVRDPQTRELLHMHIACVSTTLGEGTGLSRYKEAEDAAVKRTAYAEWVVRKLSPGDDRPDPGLDVIDVPQIVSVRKHEVIRKVRDRHKPILTPCVRARVLVRVRDVELASAYLRQGMGKLKDIGLGAMIPVEVLEDLS